MKNLSSLNEIISFDKEFKSSVNLYLNLNSKEKILGYIPTNSSVALLEDFLLSIINNKENASILIGPYGKGKSHLLLVLLAIVSMERTKENQAIVSRLKEKISKVEIIGKAASDHIDFIWRKMGRFMPILITNTQDDLNQAFLMALNDSLKREGIVDIIPQTYYSIAVEKIEDWQRNYPDTYKLLNEKVEANNKTLIELKTGITCFSKSDLKLFTNLYPQLTSGGEFNPLATSDPFTIYKSISEKLVSEYNYSGIYIVFDEFSKYMESQDKNANGANMKLLQDICELANDSQNSQVRITMVAHKSIKEYGKYLSNETINAFSGIEGRIIEKLFITSSKNNYELIQNAIKKKGEFLNEIPNYNFYLGKARLNQFYQIPAFKSLFNLDDFNRIVFTGCYPLNPIGAFLLLCISEKVAQNERTLFTFISNSEPNSMARFVENHTTEMQWGIGIDLIYDYFSILFKKEIQNEHVHNEWLNAEFALSKCSNELHKKIIKALAIFLIANKDDEMPASEENIALSIEMNNISEQVNELISMQIIYKRKSTNSLTFKTRAGSALKNEIKRQRSIRGDKVNYGKVLEHVTNKYYVIPKRYNIKYMMTRYFRHEYIEASEFLNINDAKVFFSSDEFADGKVLSLFSSSKINMKQIKEHVKALKCNNLIVVCPHETVDIAKPAQDYEILLDIRNDNSFTNDNEVMKTEMPIMEEELSNEIKINIYKIYQGDDNCKVLYNNNGSIFSQKYSELEKVVSKRCEEIYYKTPLINNEIINRREITTAQTKRARLTIIQAIMDHADNEQFYTGSSQEATIYRSILVVTGIRSNVISDQMKEVFDIIICFLESCSDSKKKLNDLIYCLQHEPYGIRAGIIPIILAYVLSKRNEDIIVYFDKMETPICAEAIVNMCENPNDYSIFMSKSDLKKEKYIESLNLLFCVKDNRNLSTNRIKNILICMQRWFRSLPFATKNALTYEDYEIDDEVKKYLPRIRNLMLQTNYNPYEIIFIKMPEIFSTDNDYEETFIRLNTCKTSFDDYYDWIVLRAVEGTKKIFDVRKRQDLYHVVKEWYNNQTELTKNGLLSSTITGLMSCIEKLKVYDETEITKKIIKSVFDVYIEDWNDESYKEYLKILNKTKSEIESLRESRSSEKLTLSFIDKNGNKVNKLYEYASEGSGKVLRNIIEDSLEEFDDMSVNDRVAILLEMIEKVIK